MESLALRAGTLGGGSDLGISRYPRLASLVVAGVFLALGCTNARDQATSTNDGGVDHGGGGSGGGAGSGGRAGSGAAGGMGGGTGGSSAGAGGSGGKGGAGTGGGTGGSSAGAGGSGGKSGAGTGGGPAGTGGSQGGAGGANPCADGVKNGSETDVDCGGSCAKCALNKACGVDGDCKTGSCSHLFCSLVSGPPNWLPGPSLNDGRGLVTVGVVPMGNGQMVMLAIGGRDDSDNSDPPVASSYEILDTSQTPSVWSAPALLPNGVAGPAVTDASGEILTFADSATWGYFSFWAMLSGVMPTPRQGAAATVALSGSVYVVGGYADSSGTPSAVIEAYNPTTGKWTSGLAPMPAPRVNLAVATGSDGQIYAIGGSGNLSGTAIAYDIATNSWSTVSALPDPSADLAAVGAPDGRIYAIGGQVPAQGSVLDTVNAYSPATNRWTPVVPLSSVRFGVGAALAPDGRLYAVGGTTNVEGEGFKTVEVYGPVVSASPLSGAPGSSVAVNGSNFAASATVSVYFGSTTSSPLATGTTNTTGALNTPITFTVPNLAGGNQTLIVMDDRSQYPITFTFRVQ